MIKVLVVDDEHLIRRGIAKIIGEITATHLAVTQAANGEEALAFMAAIPFDLLLTDIKMPKMGGIEFLKRSSREYPAVVKIVLSGFDEFDYVREALRNQVEDYLLKPVDEGELKMAVVKAARLVLASRSTDPTGCKEFFERFALPETAGAREANRTGTTIKLVKTYLKKNYQKHISLESAASFACVNPNYLSEMFRRETGITFVDYLTQVRIEAAKKILLDPRIRAYEVGLKVGYDDPVYFSKVFKKFVGLSPKDFRKVPGDGAESLP